MKREIAMLLLVLVVCASLAPALGLGCRYDPRGGPVSLASAGLEQSGRVLVQRGDTANHVLAALGQPTLQTATRWSYAAPPCTIVLEDAHVQEIRVGEDQIR